MSDRENRKSGAHRPHTRHRPRLRDRIGMTLTFSLFVCGVFLVTAGIISGIGVILTRSGAMEHLEGMAPIVLVLVVLVACVIVGTIVSTLLGYFPLKSIRKVIRQMRQLAAGDFGVRLAIDRPPEMRELSDSFNSMAKELGSIELLRSDFVNNFSHEFKTPIVSIKGFAELLKYGDLTDAERNEYLDIVISEAARLAELSSNVLYLSKVENQTILSDQDRAPIALGEQIRHTILLLRAKWEEKRITMHVDLEDLTCRGNEEMLGQVWLNLIDNAVKFTPEDGAVWVGLARRGVDAVFTVRDSGPGIREEALPRVFDRFYQADTSHATAGNGLGLTLVHKIVQLHGGTIDCHSAEGRGTTFTVVLPGA